MALGPKEEAETYRIGQRLRNLRELYGLSLRDMAERTELSAAYLSQMENGKALPSLKVLQKLGDSFGKSIAYFFEADQSEEPVLLFPREEQTELTSQGGLRHIRILTPGVQLEINPVEVRLEPGNIAEAEPSTHDGWEYVYVVEGQMRLHLGERTVDVRKGDGIAFKCSIPHMAENTGEATAIGLWIGFRR